MEYLLSVIYTLVIGYALGELARLIKLPKLLGYLVAGIILGNSGLSLLSENYLSYSSTISAFALVVILIKAGLGIDGKTLKKVGRPAILMGFLPNLLEGTTVLLLSHYLLNLDWVVSGMLGFIISAVSPAVVIPSMVKLKDEGYGMDKGIPVMNLASASIDDVISLTAFAVFLSYYISGGTSNITIEIIKIPFSIIWGIGFGLILGYIIIKSLKYSNKLIIQYIQVFIILLISFITKLFGHYIFIAEMISIMTMAFIIVEKNPKLGNSTKVHINSIWKVAQIFLFVLIGAIVDFNVASNIGYIGVIIIGVGLLVRSFGVILCLIKTQFNIKERTFCVISNFPKATVQATLGAVPLSEGVIGGDIIVAVAVMSILLSAPIGLILIEAFAPKLLNKQAI